MPEPFPVQGDDLEYESNALGIETIVRIRRNNQGMREPGAAHAAGQRDDKDEPIRTTNNYCWSHSPLLMSFCIGEIHEPDSTIFCMKTAFAIFIWGMRRPSLMCVSCDLVLQGF